MEFPNAVNGITAPQGVGFPPTVDQRMRTGVFDEMPASRARRKALRGILAMLAAVAGGLGVRWALRHIFGFQAPYMAYFPWIVAAGAVGGLASGILTLAAFVAISALGLKSATLIPLRTPMEGLVLFAFAGAILILVWEWASRLRAHSRHASATLRESEERLLMALEAGSMGTWDWTIRTGKVVWSSALEKIHGLAPGSFAGNLDDVLATVHEGDLARVTATVGEALDRRAEYHIEYRIVTPDKQQRWLEARGRVFCDEHGQPCRMTGVCMDVTERRQAEEAVRTNEQRYRALAEEAERAGRVKDQFLAVLSHELRTPLSPVLLTISMLESSPDLPPAFRENVASARRNIELEARLIDDLLDLTRIARGKIRCDFQLVDLHALIRSAVSVCCTDGKLTLHTDLAAHPPTVRGDPGRLQQVFCNLLANAWKFTPAGGSVTIATRQAGDAVRVDVIDTGVGIEPEMLPKIFDAFEQGDAVTARKLGGLGLGLAIAKALVEAHAGTIRAESHGPGRGARFTVEFPTADAPAAAPQTQRSPNSDPDHFRLRMLLVEDHPSTLAALERLLNSVGHDVHGVCCVADALQASRTGRYDLVISDIGLPDGSGYELMRQLRAAHGLRGIALSGFGMDEDRARSRDAGFADHLVKPVDLEKLQAAIGRVASPDAEEKDV